MGALALVDGGETDWKLLVVDSNSTGETWQDVHDIPTERIDQVREWFRMYKTADGKAENTYAFNGRAVDAQHVGTSIET